MKEVTIYSTSTCHYCNLAKQFFAEHNIPYTEYNVQNDLSKRQEMIALTGQMGVPVIKVGDEAIVGFQVGRLASMLGIV